MAGFFARRRFRKDVLGRVRAMLLAYPGGLRVLERNYPNLGTAIDGNFAAGDMSAAHSALTIAAAVLTNEIGALEQDQRSLIREQLSALDLSKFRELLSKGQAFSEGMLIGTSLVALAYVMVEASLRDGEITKNEFNQFTSEVFGSLDGKDANQRSYERMREVLDETLGPPPLRISEADLSHVQPSAGWSGEMGKLNGAECDVRLVDTSTGIAMVRLDNGAEIVERRSLSQDELAKVPSEHRQDCRFVNLHTRDGEIVSCLIYGEDSEVVGSSRAFWWSLAKVSVKMIDVRAAGVRMSENALAQVHAAARGMWDSVIQEAYSIENLRDQPVFMRNVRFGVILKMIDQYDAEADKLGLEICKAMVLAVQSEDELLEAEAYRRFRRFLWRPGEEPSEFYPHG